MGTNNNNSAVFPSEADNLSELNVSPALIQQEYFENLPECDWVRYEADNRNHLLQNVAFALFGTPSMEGDLTDMFDTQEAHLQGYTSRQKEQVLKVYEKICQQSKYSQNDIDIYMSVILVVCARPKPVKFYQIEPKNHWVDLHQRTDIDIWNTAVFRIRKCIPTTGDVKPCRLYIDESARVYNSWEAYLEDNVLPKCVLVAPEGGEYNGTLDEDTKQVLVKLSVTPSPALGLTARVLSSADTVTTIASIGALGVLGVAAFTPLAPVVLIGATVATVGTGVYGLVRSSVHLHDRRTHQQTISPTDAEARGSWINIAASTAGLAAAGAASLLNKAAQTGANLTKTGRALAISVDVLRHANLITGGAGVMHSLVHIVMKYRKHGEAPTKLEIFQFTSATLFFFNAAISNRTAKNIIEDAQANTINEYRDTLRSNRHRKIFDKLSAESRRIQGAIEGNTEVIRGIKNIVNKDQYYADVLRMNKQLNEHKLRISMTADGKVNINAQHKFNPAELSGLGKDGRAQLFQNLGPNTPGPANVSTKVIPSNVSTKPYIDDEEPNNMLVGIHPGEILRIGSLFIRVSSSGAQNIASLLENLSQELHVNLMTISLNILSKLIPEEIGKLKLLSPDEDLVLQVVKFVFNYMRHERPLGEINDTDSSLLIVVKEFFQDGIVRQDTILKLKNRFVEWIEDEINKRNSEFPNKEQVTCRNCQGVRFIMKR